MAEQPLGAEKPAGDREERLAELAAEPMPVRWPGQTPPGWVAVIGGGPSGLMAAETLAGAGHAVRVFDAMPSVGRKFLLAGKGGLNLTHSEPFDAFAVRYGAQSATLRPLLDSFGPDALRAWAQALDVATFVGSSGRVFPVDMKAAPLLRAWLHRLRTQGVQFHMRHRWLGFSATPGALRFATPGGDVQVQPAATVLALGGASWPQLGSDGAWVPLLQQRSVDIAPLQPANCGFDVGWSGFFSERFAGAPLKSVVMRLGRPGTRGSGADESEMTGVGMGALQTAGLQAIGLHTGAWQQAGECVVTAGGVEGSLVYAASALLRDAIARDGHALLELDLLPARSTDWVARELAHPRGPRSLSTHLKTRLHLAGVKAGLLWELVPRDVLTDPQRFAVWIKALPVRVTAARPLAEAISTAGGVRFAAMNGALMLNALPGIFCTGEMLDWEAPTGGYLLTACFASGRAAGLGAAAWVSSTALR